MRCPEGIFNFLLRGGFDIEPDGGDTPKAVPAKEMSGDNEASSELQDLLCDQFIQLFEVVYLASIAGALFDGVKFMLYGTADLLSQQP
jgi:hypothetical protein